MQVPTLSTAKIAVVGLGYVGLPLAAYLVRKFPVIGFDINPGRIAELKLGRDHTRQLTDEELQWAASIRYTSSSADLRDCNFYIVTVPTPIDQARRPDLTALMRASEIVGGVIGPGNVVVYKSTVYPGATEEVCVPIIEKVSGLAYNKEFFVGYSPERINPGDPQRRLPNIKKVTSGSTPAVADLVDAVYASIIPAGTHRASSIRVAEAAKVIENIQRDLNIALVNELAQLFKRLGIETREVLEAAGTKWNFHGYRPGLVGGHCIGVDPYYLTHKAQSVGFHPEIILAGRRVNDGMAAFVARDVVTTMAKRGVRVGSARLLIMGFTFKENCPDIRNTKIADLIAELTPFVRRIDVYDPIASPQEALSEYGVEIVNDLPADQYDVIVIALRHDAIAALGADRIRQQLSGAGAFIYDLKEVLPLDLSDARV